MEPKYRLPDELGGREVMAYRFVHGAAHRWICSVVGLSYTVELPRNQLVEIPPPLPEEPPVGTTVSFFAKGNALDTGLTYKRTGYGWFSIAGVGLNWQQLLVRYPRDCFEMVIHKVKRKST